MKLSAQSQLFSRVTVQDKLLFTKHLSVMIHSGIPIIEALGILIDQTKTGSSFNTVLQSVYSRIKNGKSLAYSLEEYPKVFDVFFTNIIKVGEESGTLEESLQFLSDQLQKDYALRKKVQSALLYPSIVFLMVIILGGFISLFILPQLIGFFEAFDTELPLATKVLLAIANFFKNYGILFFSSFIIFSLAWSRLIKTKTVKPFWDRILFVVPLFGKLLRNNQTVRLSRNLGILLKSGVPIEASLETTEKTLTNTHYIRALIYIADEVKKGKTIHESMTSNPSITFQPIMIKMIDVGERTGKLDESLTYLADFYEEEIDNVTKNLSTILEPILLIFIGIVVGFIAIAIISPIYELTGSIRK
jgi:type IV pilus assembly protein PilC